MLCRTVKALWQSGRSIAPQFSAGTDFLDGHQQELRSKDRNFPDLLDLSDGYLVHTTAADVGKHRWIGLWVGQQQC